MLKTKYSKAHPNHGYYKVQVPYFQHNNICHETTTALKLFLLF